ncbi:MAG: hypothetical protein IJB70_01740 [Clostridia bacterium]|nr:hypothetical protein [Clostridia bacterium]
MDIKHVANFVRSRQDGAIFNNIFFTINAHGECYVYDMTAVDGNKIVDLKELAVFNLDKFELICPHSNSVVFGNEYYCEDDEFPILYTNIYNNYANEKDKLVGVCLAYRIQKTTQGFTSTLVQIIEIGFVNDTTLWCSGDGADVRPYGNFVIDTQNDTYWAFTMRDKTNSTRYFSFDMPKLSDGEPDINYGVNRVVLTADDIKTCFDCEYHNYIQGACFNDGKVYSVEGFSVESGKKPALRVIDVEAKKQILHVEFIDFDLDAEPEMICFSNDICYYCDAHGHMYKLEF